MLNDVLWLIDFVVVRVDDAVDVPELDSDMLHVPEEDSDEVVDSDCDCEKENVVD